MAKARNPPPVSRSPAARAPLNWRWARLRKPPPVTRSPIALALVAIRLARARNPPPVSRSPVARRRFHPLGIAGGDTTSESVSGRALGTWRKFTRVWASAESCSDWSVNLLLILYLAPSSRKFCIGSCGSQEAMCKNAVGAFTVSSHRGLTPVQSSIRAP